MADLAWKRVPAPHAWPDAPARYVADAARVRLAVDAAPGNAWIWWVLMRGDRGGWIATLSGPSRDEPPITELDHAQRAAELAARRRALL